MNFSPKLLNSKNVPSNTKLEKLHCKNFIFTILMFDLLNLRNNSNFKPFNFSFIITKKRKHYGSTLRAPYKSKIAQFSLGIYRYFMSLIFYIKTNYIYILNNKLDFFDINHKFLNSYNYFESALITQVSRSFYMPIKINII